MSEKRSQSVDHVPDVSLLPKLGEWLPMDSERLWNDGTQILVAVPVRNRHSETWYGDKPKVAGSNPAR